MSKPNLPKMPRNIPTPLFFGGSHKDDTYDEECLLVHETAVEEYTSAIRYHIAEISDYIKCLRSKGYIVKGITFDKTVAAEKTEKVKIL